jgi:hypothetical protein
MEYIPVRENGKDWSSTSFGGQEKLALLDSFIPHKEGSYFHRLARWQDDESAFCLV